MPHDYLELYLCRDVYHCTPMELKAIPLPVIMRHLTCIRAENDYRAEKGG